MVSPLESLIRKQVASAFKGKLLTGTYRQPTDTGALDKFGDPVLTTFTTFSCEGIVDQFSEMFKKDAGIPEGDVKILIIAGSLDTTPTKDDKVKFRNQWYQIRAVSKDPANATWELQAFETSDPT